MSLLVWMPLNEDWSGGADRKFFNKGLKEVTVDIVPLMTTVSGGKTGGS